MRISIRRSIIYIGLIASTSFVACTDKQYSKYQCPMKCEQEKTYDKPSKCPVCGMNIKGIE
ncbi:MAG: hypothetical protein JNK00_00930 [Flavipsychrobacter sp.]|nr:hypothetical protein [Flavipsychrobacter sp.]